MNQLSISSSPLLLRELFHLEVLRGLGRKLKPGTYALKGGVNLRFFFGSPRYSEDMDLDVAGIGVTVLADAVMAIIGSRQLRELLASFGVSRVVAPDMARAKQTETTQRFKVHLVTAAGEDLFTKVEFSRRGMDADGVAVESVRAGILRELRLPPLLCPHYTAVAALAQKVRALADRKEPQARDVFDCYLLSTQSALSDRGRGMDRAVLKKAIDNVFLVGFDRFRDTVLTYFPQDERAAYDDPGQWDGIRLAVSRCIEELR
jgi:hypothetical protein